MLDTSTHSLLQACRLLRQLSSQVRVSQVELLLLVADQPGRSLSHYAQQADLSLSGVSRFVDVFGSTGRRDGRGTQPLGLLFASSEAADDRTVLLDLTPKGERFLALLSQVMA